MNAAQNTAAAPAAPVEEAKKAKEVKAKPAVISFNGETKVNLEPLNLALNKISSRMGGYRAKAEAHGLLREVTEMGGRKIAFVSPEMATKLRAADLISTDDAADIRAFHALLKACEAVLESESKRAVTAAKMKAK